jgi:hypothetical protein
MFLPGLIIETVVFSSQGPCSKQNHLQWSSVSVRAGTRTKRVSCSLSLTHSLFLLSRQVSLTSFRCAPTVRAGFSTCRDKIEMPAKVPASLLSRQVSNLNSSDPESDVLPITLRDNFRGANIKKFIQKHFRREEFDFKIGYKVRGMRCEA